MAFTFNGGIHVAEHKNTRRCAIEAMPSPKIVSIPMSQHIGANATPVVKPGDIVDKGQVIGVIENGLGCPVHASVSGKVTEIIEINTADASAKIRSVVIENDGENRLSPDCVPWPKRLADTTTEEIIEIVRKAGISGMGGATFPTYAKISSAVGKVERIIVNCAECEPFLTANHRLLLENPDAVINGLKILMKALSLREGDIAVEDNKPDAIAKLEERLSGSDMIKVRVLKTKYPQGDERQIIYALTGKELPAGKLPADIGCCVFNAETCAAIYSAFVNGMPLIERIVTVDGDCIKNPKNVLVPIGTSFIDLINFCGGLTKEPRKVLTGGPMMGWARWNMSTAVIKGTSGLLAFSKAMDVEYDQPPRCIRCGRCVAGCPMRLMPNYLAMFAAQRKFDQCEEFDVMSCVECGSCSYSCPAHVPIVQRIRAAKSKIKDLRAAQAAALKQSQKSSDKDQK